MYNKTNEFFPNNPIEKKLFQKKVKISSVKRSQHVKHKKNYARPAKKQEKTSKAAKATQNALSTNKKVFGKPIGAGTAKRTATKVRRETAKTTALETQQNKLINGGKNGRDGNDKKNGEKETADESEEEEHDIDDLMEMMEADDELHMAYGAAAKRRKREVDDEDNGKQHEVEHAHELDVKHASNMQTIDLLPIKTKAGEIITRSTEVEIVEKEQDEDDGDADDEDVEEEIVDSDDDIVNDKRTTLGSMNPEANKNAISTTDLLIYREQEVNRQKFRIANICSGILENPEHKMKNFNALFELMDERINDTVNLFTVRKLAITSLLEVFKDILPEYRIGQIDLKKQTGLLSGFSWKSQNLAL